ncbi:MAG: hypothetical protein BWY76_03136 [bacterium ADurb.Bin429]|nr:MAG: hypothetical protein BWY76_03136 [bacterium ADurb.Bin429]
MRAANRVEIDQVDTLVRADNRRVEGREEPRDGEAIVAHKGDFAQFGEGAPATFGRCFAILADGHRVPVSVHVTDERGQLLLRVVLQFGKGERQRAQITVDRQVVLHRQLIHVVALHVFEAIATRIGPRPVLIEVVVNELSEEVSHRPPDKGGILRRHHVEINGEQDAAAGIEQLGDIGHPRQQAVALSLINRFFAQHGGHRAAQPGDVAGIFVATADGADGHHIHIATGEERLHMGAD